VKPIVDSALITDLFSSDISSCQRVFVSNTVQSKSESTISGRRDCQKQEVHNMASASQQKPERRLASSNPHDARTSSKLPRLPKSEYFHTQVVTAWIRYLVSRQADAILAKQRKSLSYRSDVLHCFASSYLSTSKFPHQANIPRHTNHKTPSNPPTNPLPLHVPLLSQSNLPRYTYALRLRPKARALIDVRNRQTRHTSHTRSLFWATGAGWAYQRRWKWQKCGERCGEDQGD
jgi:hypothetical protein